MAITTSFNLVAQGTVSVGSELWVNLATIPTGGVDWVGSWTLTTINKAMSADLRTNLVGQSAGTLAATKILGTMSISKAGGSATQDLYKKGALHTVTVTGTGVEKLWLRLYAKSAIAGTAQYKVIYTTQ
jgi:hypothetical protein